MTMLRNLPKKAQLYLLLLAAKVIFSSFCLWQQNPTIRRHLFEYILPTSTVDICSLSKHVFLPQFQPKCP